MEAISMHLADDGGATRWSEAAVMALDRDACFACFHHAIETTITATKEEVDFAIADKNANMEGCARSFLWRSEERGTSRVSASAQHRKQTQAKIAHSCQ